MGYGASHTRKSKKPKLVFESQEEWRESAIKNEYTGLTAIEVFREQGQEATQWYKAFKNWLEFTIVSITTQKRIITFVLAEKEEE